MNLGTVNGHWPMRASVNGRPFIYPGTTLGLTLAALQAGARVGDTITTDDYTYILAATGGGDRTPGGVWATDARWAR